MYLTFEGVKKLDRPVMCEDLTHHPDHACMGGQPERETRAWFPVWECLAHSQDEMDEMEGHCSDCPATQYPNLNPATT